MKPVELTQEMVDKVFENICINEDSNDADFNPAEVKEEEEEVDDNSQSKRRRLIAHPESPVTHDIPQQYRHIRNLICSVKPDYYKTIVQLKSKFHCSEAQAVAGIILTAQNLFHLP